MPHVRGFVVLNTIRYLRERYGAGAHERVLATLPPAQYATFASGLREASWEPLSDLVAYMEAARRLLAPGDDELYRNMGRFSGNLARAQSATRVMVQDPASTLRMGATLWSTYYDAGRLSLTALNADETLLRVHDFPIHRPICERNGGAFEGLVTDPGRPASHRESACVAWGDPHCEYVVTWPPREG